MRYLMASYYPGSSVLKQILREDSQCFYCWQWCDCLDVHLPNEASSLFSTIFVFIPNLSTLRYTENRSCVHIGISIYLVILAWAFFFFFLLSSSSSFFFFLLENCPAPSVFSSKSLNPWLNHLTCSWTCIQNKWNGCGVWCNHKSWSPASLRLPSDVVKIMLLLYADRCSALPSYDYAPAPFVFTITCPRLFCCGSPSKCVQYHSRFLLLGAISSNGPTLHLVHLGSPIH